MLNDTETFENLMKAMKASPRKIWLSFKKVIELSLWLLGDYKYSILLLNIGIFLIELSQFLIGRARLLQGHSELTIAKHTQANAKWQIHRDAADRIFL